MRLHQRPEDGCCGDVVIIAPPCPSLHKAREIVSRDVAQINFLLSTSESCDFAEAVFLANDQPTISRLEVIDESWLMTRTRFIEIFLALYEKATETVHGLAYARLQLSRI